MTLTYRAVVAEDELPILENLVGKICALEQPVQVVGTATDGEQALELITKLRPHILMTDIKMPMMDGMTLIQKALELLPGLKVIIISGYSEFEYAKQALQYGVADYLLKPVSAEELSGTVQKVLESLCEHSALRERGIIVSHLQGDHFPGVLPSDIADHMFDMYLICLGGFYDKHQNTQDLERVALLWERLALTELLGRHAVPDSRWWLVGERQPNCRILIVTHQPGLPDEAAFHQLLASLEEACALTICGMCEPVSFCKIWQTAQQLRELMGRTVVPSLSQAVISHGVQQKRCYVPYHCGGAAKELAEGIKKQMDDNYLTPITVETLAELFHFSPSYITRIFKKEYGVPPFKYLLGLRIDEAKRMIRANDSLNIGLVAQAVGYEDQHYFSRIFKNVTGLSPSEYKKNQGSATCK